jgi:hypothetical protein
MRKRTVITIGHAYRMIPLTEEEVTLALLQGNKLCKPDDGIGCGCKPTTTCYYFLATERTLSGIRVDKGYWRYEWIEIMNPIPFTVENQTKFVLAGGFCIHCLGRKEAHFSVHCQACADFKTHGTNSVCLSWLLWIRNGT